jgi:Asp-tRNA(Asn)/Glu-tRNA(Gln) amidotransferase A subunit family amidase
VASDVPARDADAAARLKAAGAIVFGKTNLPLSAGDFQSFNDVDRVSNNPWDPTRTVGGSSGGAAAAVACGMTLMELGSDIGGSIRAPAHYNGVFGHESTFGAVAHRGHVPLAPGLLAMADLGVMGSLGRSAADLALAMDVLAPTLPANTVDLGRPRRFHPTPTHRLTPHPTPVHVTVIRLTREEVGMTWTAGLAGFMDERDDSDALGPTPELPSVEVRTAPLATPLPDRALSFPMPVCVTAMRFTNQEEAMT